MTDSVRTTISHLGASNSETFMGVLYWQVVKLVRGVVEKARLRAFAMVELVPSRDPEELSALTAGRIFSNAIGAALQP